MEHVIDATNKKLGRLASDIAVILQGKTHPSYDPKISGSDTVHVKNISKMVVTGRKYEQKIYYKHAGPLGHLKERKLSDTLDENPEWVLRHAVNLMLPKNKLRAKRIRRLIIEK
jgi:large subunit ribosomal protein L13